MILPYMLIIFNRLLWSLLFPTVLFYKHRAEHEFCPEALFAVFDTFIALGLCGVNKLTEHTFTVHFVYQ